MTPTRKVMVICHDQNRHPSRQSVVGAWSIDDEGVVWFSPSKHAPRPVVGVTESFHRHVLTCHLCGPRASVLMTSESSEVLGREALEQIPAVTLAWARRRALALRDG